MPYESRGIWIEEKGGGGTVKGRTFKVHSVTYQSDRKGVSSGLGGHSL